MPQNFPERKNAGSRLTLEKETYSMKGSKQNRKQRQEKRVMSIYFLSFHKFPLPLAQSFSCTCINPFVLVLNSALFLFGSSPICFNVPFSSLSQFILPFILFYAAMTYHSVVLPVLRYHSQQATICKQK